jgi:hypothetical protein
MNYILSQALKLFGLIRAVTFSFSYIDSLVMLSFTLVRSRLEYAFVALTLLTPVSLSVFSQSF